MHQHSPDSLAGPLRGTTAWWQGRKDDDLPSDDAATPEEPPVETAAATPKRPRRQRKIRVELVNRVRQEIADGKYDTPDKFQAALETLLERMGD